MPKPRDVGDFAAKVFAVQRAARRGSIEAILRETAIAASRFPTAHPGRGIMLAGAGVVSLLLAGVATAWRVVASREATPGNGSRAASVAVVAQQGPLKTCPGGPAPCSYDAMISDMERNDGAVCTKSGRSGLWTVYSDDTGGHVEPETGALTAFSLLPKCRDKSAYAFHFRGGGFTGWGVGAAANFATEP